MNTKSIEDIYREQAFIKELLQERADLGKKINAVNTLLQKYGHRVELHEFIQPVEEPLNWDDVERKFREYRASLDGKETISSYTFYLAHRYKLPVPLAEKLAEDLKDK